MPRDFGECRANCSDANSPALQQSADSIDLVYKTLRTLHGFLSWVPVGFIFENDLIELITGRVSCEACCGGNTALCSAACGVRYNWPLLAVLAGPELPRALRAMSGRNLVNRYRGRAQIRKSARHSNARRACRRLCTTCVNLFSRVFSVGQALGIKLEPGAVKYVQTSVVYTALDLPTTLHWRATDEQPFRALDSTPCSKRSWRC